MPPSKTRTRSKSPPAFLGATSAKSAKGYHAAVFGAPHGTPYPGTDNRVHAGAAKAFREALASDAEWIGHWDYDLGRPLFDGGLKIADLGDLPTKPKDGAGNRSRIETCTRAILEADAVPIMFGGDDSTPIPFIAAYGGGPPIAILQIDAHIDWRDERYGERQGFSSTMRRASEKSHVWRIVQAGARGMGSARPQEIEDAARWGARIVTARDIHRAGTDSVLAHLPEDCDCVISLDCDALDVTQMPAVAYPSPGGLTFNEVIDLIDGVARKARIAGFTMVEFVPGRDPAGTAAFTAARIACNVIGRLKRPH